jgi:putative FmdB family regulatory protein
MPLYEYECQKCGERFEIIQKFSDPLVTAHETCGGVVKKLLSAPAIQFKGSGWYITDYARAGKNGSAKDGDSSTSESKASEGKSSESKASESKPVSKSESKPESKPSDSKSSSSGDSGTATTTAKSTDSPKK